MKYYETKFTAYAAFFVIFFFTFTSSVEANGITIGTDVNCGYARISQWNLGPCLIYVD